MKFNSTQTNREQSVHCGTAENVIKIFYFNSANLFSDPWPG